MKAHFFDIDAIMTTDAKVWIVDKSNPKEWIVKISQSDFNLIRKGIFRSKGNKISFAGDDYWVSDEIMSKIMRNSKFKGSDTSNLAFSAREFLDQDLIGSSNCDLLIENLYHLKNTQDDVYVICSKNTKQNYESMIEKIEDKLSELGIAIKRYYYISETFYERDEDRTAYDKARLVVQHLIGYRTDGGIVSEEEIESYDEISYYDDDVDVIKTISQSNDVLKSILSGSDPSLIERIKLDIKSRKPLIEMFLVTPNKMNRFVRTKSVLDMSNVIKSFESYKRLF